MSFSLVQFQRIALELLNLGGVKVGLLLDQVVVVGVVDLDAEGVLGRWEVVSLHLLYRSEVTHGHSQGEKGVLGALPLFGRGDRFANLQLGELGQLVELDAQGDKLASEEERVGDGSAHKEDKVGQE